MLPEVNRFYIMALGGLAMYQLILTIFTFNNRFIQIFDNILGALVLIPFGIHAGSLIQDH